MRSRETDKENVQDKSKPMVIVGSDVEALYPSLDDISVVNTAYQAVMDTELQFSNINYKDGVKYIVSNLTEQEEDWLKTRHDRRGSSWIER